MNPAHEMAAELAAIAGRVLHIGAVVRVRIVRIGEYPAIENQARRVLVRHAEQLPHGVASDRQAGKDRASIFPQLPACFTTALLRKGIDPVTVAKLGGWKSVRQVFETYGHANDDLTITDMISDALATRPTERNARKLNKTGIS